ncbi:putative zinc-containing alcohol dehydrogenase [Paramyrothecium foliicola]|nr:putative zinc-containing alcohol dehydrogenase [Paramyrothecium foliicola]
MPEAYWPAFGVGSELALFQDLKSERRRQRGLLASLDEHLESYNIGVNSISSIQQSLDIMARQWILTGQEGFEKSLEFQKNVKIPSPGELGPNEVLVSLQAASLNYRDLVIAGPMGINGPITPPVVPCCDGAGTVEAVGQSVQEFKPGDRVITYLVPNLVETSGDDAVAGVEVAVDALGQGPDGTLRSKGVFSEKALAHAPISLNWISAATLPCTWLTAWNALFGLKDKAIGPGSWVLVQGTGGVSIATLQVAVAAGATVVATTSTPEKEERLKELGAAYTINYRTNSEDWGKKARDLTPDRRGFDIIVEIGGDASLPQSLAAIKVDGVVVLAGYVGGEAQPVPLFSAFMHSCIVRVILGGTRSQLRELAKFVDEKCLKPAVDDVVFELEDAKSAYRRLKEKMHFSKVVIEIRH